MARKGIILAGGTGTRLFPLTIATNKQLLPVYDCPLIYYPMASLMKAEIDEILIIVASKESEQTFRKLFGFGDDFGIHIDYAIQEKPNGIAEAFIIAEDFLDGSVCALALGDNIFYGHQFDAMLPNINDNQNIIFGCKVKNPTRYGVAEFNIHNKVISIEEKPKLPKSEYAVPGLYFYDNTVVEKAKTLKPSARGEIEITDINNLYIMENNLSIIKLPPGTAWFDAGTYDDLLEAGEFMRAIQSRTGVMAADLKGISQANGWL
ncbi:MAG: sugar phosphate nucleotidyltransferase [bacterium]|nr:sugar phosphate nucleotidyltransferase [bacterium]